tara:strand:- start:140 stop:529 length:390 start_codon:yes stop_codon:yes gene_type:complete
MADKQYVSVEGAVTGAGSNTEVTLQLPTTPGGVGGEIFLIRRLHLARTSGSATQWQPRFGDAAGFSGDGIDELVKYDQVDVGASNDVFAQDIPFKTDSNGRLYFRPGFVGVSTDNAMSYKFYFEAVKGS